MNFESSAAHTEKVFKRNQELIETFHIVNKVIISRTSDGLKNFLQEHTELIRDELKRLKWAAANRLRPEEFINNLYETNGKILRTLLSLDHKLDRIAEKINASNNSGSNKNPVYRSLLVNAQKFLKNRTANINGKQ